MAKIGIMSFAHMHAYSYAACVKELPSAELTAVWDDNPRRGRTAAKQFGARFIGDLDAFLASGIEGVIITSENVKHRSTVERAAAAGQWILCEKPLATTVADAKAMIACCKKAGVGLGTAFPCRYSPPLMEAKRLLDSGEYGTVYAACCTNNGSFPGGWFAEPALAGGGATMDHTAHVAELCRWLFGREFKTVYCEIGRQVHHGVKTDDMGSLHLEMDGDIQVSHIASWNRAKSFPTWGDVTLEIIAQNGVISVDAFNQKLNVYNDDVMKTEWAYWGSNPDLGLVADFVTAVDARRAPGVTGEDGLRAVEVTVAAYKSAKSRKVVAV
jgi:predicted dehydrogenase